MRSRRVSGSRSLAPPASNNCSKAGAIAGLSRPGIRIWLTPCIGAVAVKGETGDYALQLDACTRFRLLPSGDLHGDTSDHEVTEPKDGLGLARKGLPRHVPEELSYACAPGRAHRVSRVR